ncbi:hypothetical protein [Mycobacterium sp.]|uniref:hypothetical protein n=1 Tax=Mycobacterium sp. TaxID=1785 RepID=UPI0039C9747E
MPDEPIEADSGDDQERAAAPADREAAPPDSEAAPPDSEAAPPDHAAGPMISAYGVASAVLGLVCVGAVVLSYLIWSAHHQRVENANYELRTAQAAVDWTGVLINMNKDNVDSSLNRLHDGTVGELNNDFDAVIKPYREVVLALQARSSGQINSVSIESLHHNLDAQPGAPPPKPEQAPPEFASRTDTVLIVATSVSENAGSQGKPQTVRWNLRLGVSDVDGKLLISRLEPIR